MTLAGCKSSTTANPADGTTAASDPNAPDPTAVNMAPVDQTGTQAPAQGPTQVAGYAQQAQPTQQSYTNPTPAPIERRAPSDSGYQNDYNNDDSDAEAGYNATLDAISAPQPPPPLPTYEQPEAPDPNYLWTPGYWNYAPQGYYWVPGAWVQPPYTGALWTPGYWGGYGSGYRFHRGFWAAHIGFYGGINYGFGYFGTGYQGGYWNGDNFYYNRECNRVNDRVIRNVYQRNVVINNTVINNTTINNRTVNNVSYNGGRGGVQVQPRPAELAVLREQRVAPMQAQIQHQQQAAQNRQQFFAENKGRPALVAAVQPLRADRGIVAPPHTTAQINRALPVPQQIQQERQFAHPGAQPVSNVARPVATPNQPNRLPQNEPQRQPVQQPGQQNRPGSFANNQPNRGVQPVRPNEPQNRAAQPANRPNPQVPARTVTPQQQARPQEQQRAVPQRPTPAQQPARPQPQVERSQPQPTARPQVQQHFQQPRPQPQAQQPRPQPQVQQPRPQPQQRPQPQVQQQRPQAQPHPQAQQPHPAPQSQPEPHEPHGRR
jgi:hypothetical protein